MSFARSVQRTGPLSHFRERNTIVAGQGTPAVTLLTRQRISYRLHTYRPDPRHSSPGEEAAEALQTSPDRVVKTLIADTGEGMVAAVLPVNTQLDLAALAAAAGTKRARMADAAAASRATGYVTGGIPPFAHRRNLPVVMDTAVDRDDTVLCSGGRRGLEIEIAPSDLIWVASATMGSIAV